MKPERKGTGVLHTKCKGGGDHEYKIFWELENHRDGVTNDAKEKWCYSINEDSELFQFEIVDEGTYMRVQEIRNNGNVRYSAKGIPEAFIRRAYEMFQIPIGSSKQLFVDKILAEQHSKDAGKVWKRLVSWGEAYRDDIEERYFYPNERRAAPVVLAEPEAETAGRPLEEPPGEDPCPNAGISC
jgi:hypothetical protein